MTYPSPQEQSGTRKGRVRSARLVLRRAAVLTHLRGAGAHAAQAGGPWHGRRGRPAWDRLGFRNRRVIIAIADTSGLLAALDSAHPEHRAV